MIIVVIVLNLPCLFLTDFVRRARTLQLCQVSLISSVIALLCNKALN
jgi:hypothetical protein